MSYSETLRVRFRDTDAQGHMFFANYQVFADEVAGNYMRTLGFDWSRPEDLPCYVFTVNVNCDYLNECHSGEDVRVEVAYQRIGNTSATLGFSLTRTRDQQTLARGAFTQVFVDRKTRKPISVPPTVRAAVPAQ
ncbi:MAG: acyl-CoA thioester hydrolase [Halieaceae bacterium]|jgi:acyl-CoA thioester hydrolase